MFFDKRIVAHLPKIFIKKWYHPIYFTFFITHRCQLRCLHCFDWRRNQEILEKSELKLNEIKKVSKNMDDILFMFLTGGEPFLREDISKIAHIFHKNNNVPKIEIPTNGFMSEVIIEETEKILKQNKDLNLSVTVSLDGPERIHDRIRGVKGSYKNAVKTLKDLLELEKQYRNFSTGVTITFNHYNQNYVEGFYKFLRDKIGVKSIFMNLVRGDVRDLLSKKVDLNKYRNALKIMEEDLIRGRIGGYRNFMFADLINYKELYEKKIVFKTLKEKRQIVPCLAGDLYGIMHANGDVYPCEMKDFKLGNVRDVDYDIKKIWLSERTKKFKKYVRTKCYCTHECAISSSILLNYKELFKLDVSYLKNLFRKF